MRVNESFFQQSVDLIKPSPDYRYDLVCLDINDFPAVLHYYGEEESERLLSRLEHFLETADGFLLHQHLFSDYFLCVTRRGIRQTDQDAVRQLDKLIGRFLAEVGPDYPELSLKIACGICPAAEGGISRAIEGANIARKEAKYSGCRMPVFYDDRMEQKYEQKYEMEKTVNDAIREEQFCFYLQPKVDLTNGKIAGAEALARRIGADGSIIYPDSFLAHMESSGSVVELDILIFRQVCRLMADRIKRGLPVVRTSVNLSHLHTENQTIAGTLDAIAREYQIAPELLEFELSESTLTSDFAGSKQLIAALRAHGYSVSIDNFGSGFTGINVWRELDYDCLKLDKRFLCEDPSVKSRNEVLLPNIIDISRRLGIQILCEGVETLDECRSLATLGCTLVQGYYFSRPVPPNEFYEEYEKLEGAYPSSTLPFGASSQGPADTAEPADEKEEQPFGRQQQRYAGLILICTLLLGISIMVASIYFHHVSKNEFNKMSIENLNAYTTAQRENIRSTVGTLQSTLEALAVMVEQGENREFIDSYLMGLNKNNPEIYFLFTDNETFDEGIRRGVSSSIDTDLLARMKNGEMVISDIIYSKRRGDIYCFAIGVPVFKDGEFYGALRGIIDARKLISTSIYPPALGMVYRSFLLDNDGDVIRVSTPEGDLYPGKEAGDGNIFDLLDQYGFNGYAKESLRTALQTDTKVTETFPVDERGSSPLYLSVTDLGYNGWHFAVTIRADQAAQHSSYIVRSVIIGTLVVIAMVILFCGVILGAFQRMQKRFSTDEQRYLLLEQFSDTVLFDYNCEEDTIRFTPNAGRLFRIHDLMRPGFLHHLDQQNIYGGDLETVRLFLTGTFPPEKKDMRIRLLHPEKDYFFWCQLQYRYLREDHKVVSIVGKITDIDEQMRHEEHLKEISELDGLTGLYNKITAEVLIAARLTKDSSGYFFMVDVDDFKKVNDLYGHSTGDKVLHYLAGCLKDVFRSDDIFGRVGGDELIVYTPNMGSRKAAGIKMEQLSMIMSQYPWEGTFSASLSIGVACFPQDASDYQGLYEAADQAMYQAKRLGKNSHCFFDEISDS